MPAQLAWGAARLGGSGRDGNFFPVNLADGPRVVPIELEVQTAPTCAVQLHLADDCCTSGIHLEKSALDLVRAVAQQLDRMPAVGDDAGELFVAVHDGHEVTVYHHLDFRELGPKTCTHVSHLSCCFGNWLDVEKPHFRLLDGRLRRLRVDSKLPNKENQWKNA